MYKTRHRHGHVIKSLLPNYIILDSVLPYSTLDNCLLQWPQINQNLVSGLSWELKEALVVSGGGNGSTDGGGVGGIVVLVVMVMMATALVVFLSVVLVGVF